LANYRYEWPFSQSHDYL